MGGQGVNGVDELVAHLGREAGVLDHARAGQEHMETTGCRDHGLLQTGASDEYIVQRDFGVEVEDDIQIGQSQISIQHQHMQALAR